MIFFLLLFFPRKLDKLMYSCLFQRRDCQQQVPSFDVFCKVRSRAPTRDVNDTPSFIPFSQKPFYIPCTTRRKERKKKEKRLKKNMNREKIKGGKKGKGKIEETQGEYKWSYYERQLEILLSRVHTYFTVGKRRGIRDHEFSRRTTTRARIVCA